MRRRALGLGLTLAAALTVAVAPTGAQDTGISGEVQSLLELSFEGRRDEVEATATVGPTELSVAAAGRARRVVAAYRGPVTRARSPVRVQGAASVTITFGARAP